MSTLQTLARRYRRALHVGLGIAAVEKQVGTSGSR